MPPVSLDARLRERLHALEAQGLRRTLPTISNRAGARYRVGGRDVVGFCSNDYLGFAQAVPGAATSAGAASSRLICGDLEPHRAVERRLAAVVGAADAVLFPSGFQLNVGVLPALVSEDDTVYSDQLNHASIIDGLRLARARPQILRHRLAPVPATHDRDGLRWWVTESIFSMDGDAADADALRAAAAGGLQLYIDDAHGFGLFEGGRGWTHAHDLEPAAYVGTLSKALGCAGAFVAGSATLCEWIRTRARSFVFSTGTSPRVAEAILYGLDRLEGAAGDTARARLRANIDHLAHALRLPERPRSPIFPIVLGSNDRAVSVADALLERGWHVQAIRPPTVAPGTARLRLTLSADHEPREIDGLVAALRDVLGHVDRAHFGAPANP